MGLQIERKKVPRWCGLKKAATACGVTMTQMTRHISGVEVSQTLARKMKRLGIVVITKEAEEK